MKRNLLTLTAAFAMALLLGLALALPVLLNAPPQPASLVPADSPPSPDVTFEGMIHAVGVGTPALWVIDNYPVTVISTTVIISNGLVARPGVWTRAEAVKRGGLQATMLELQAAPTSDLYDRIEALPEAEGLWQVGNTWVHVGPETQLAGPPPAVGRLALVHGVRSGNGIDARRILVVAADSEVVYQGTLVGLGSDTWQVDDVALEITSTTVFSGPVPMVGSQVQARGVETGPRRLLATHVWTLDGIEPAVSLTGWLQRIEGQAFPYLWRVNFLDGPALRPVFVLVYDDTLVDETAGPASPGAWLSVASLHQGNAVYRAQSIAVLPRAPKRQIVGQIVDLPANGLVGIWQVDAYRVEIGQETGIVGTPGVGAMVWVSGPPDYANVLQAQLVEVVGE